MPVDAARRAIVAFNAIDIEAFVAETTPDFEWLPSMSPVDAEKFHGPDGIQKYFDLLAVAWERFEIVPDRYLEAPEVVLMLGRLVGRGRGSGATVDASLGMAFDFRRELISRIRGYLDHDEARAAVGISG